MDKFCRPLPPLQNLIIQIYIFIFISTIFTEKLSYIILIIFKYQIISQVLNNIFKLFILRCNYSV